MTNSTIERLTVTMPADMVTTIKDAVAQGGYASTSEVIREAMRDWKAKRAQQLQSLESLRADIEKGLSQLEAGQTKDFEPARIIARGRKLLASRSPSA